MTYTDDEIREHRVTYLAALEGGGYTQTQGSLRDQNEDDEQFCYCCLGVADDVSGLGEWVSDPDDIWAYRSDGLDAAGTLHPAVADWLGEDGCNPILSRPDGSTEAAIDANDYQDWTFAEIADGFRRRWNMPKEG